MSFQPPPPPPGGNPPPPPGQWGPPPGAKPAFDPKSINPLDWALLGIGAILFIFSFFEYYTFDAGGLGSESLGAWHFDDGTFIAWFAFLVGLAAAVVAALGLFMPQLKLPFPNYVAAMGLFAISAVLYILGFFIIGPDDSTCAGLSGAEHSACENAFDDAFGFGFSYWLSFILVIAGAVIALMRSQQTGAKLPGALGNLPNIGQRGPQGGIGGGHAAPGYGAPAAPPPGYGPPAAPPAPGYGPPPGPGPQPGPGAPPPPGYGPPR